MSHLDPKRPTTVRDLRNFGLLVGSVFALLAGFLAWRHQQLIAAIVLGSIAGVLLIAGAFAPRGLATPYRLWMGLAVLLSRITTPILMAVIYFLVLTPIALLRRAFGSNPLNVPGEGSRWVTRPADGRRSALDRQF